MIPHVLCIDDQLGRGGADQEVFIEALSDKGPLAEWCDLMFNPGQHDRPGERINDIDLVLDAIGQLNAQTGQWSLILLDAVFLSGKLSPAGIPEGRVGDDRFGELLRRELRARFPDIPVVMLSSKAQKELVEADVSYLSKRGLSGHALKRTLLRFGRLSADQRRSLLGVVADTVSQSKAVLDEYEKAFVHAGTGVPCLLRGESGVGKELLAEYIHAQSDRHGSFVPVNVSAIPGELIEAELFGIEKNTATGVAGRPGRFEQADKGSLFLDEIGDLPIGSQVKLLRALQNGEITRVGSRTSRPLDVRILTATAQDLEAMVEAGTFREDLLYRINTLVLTLPPLRERPDDVELLTRALLERFQTKIGKQGITLSREALDLLGRYPFRGNVRELESLVRRMIAIVGNHEVITEVVVAELIVPLDTSSPATSDRISDLRQLPLATSRTAAEGSDFSGAAVPFDRYPNARGQGKISLVELLNLLASITVDQDDPGLKGFKRTMEAATNRVLLCAAGAALERCRDPVTGAFNRQKAMRLLSGDQNLRGKGPARLINQLLGRPLHAAVETRDVEEIVKIWQGIPRKDRRAIAGG